MALVVRISCGIDRSREKFYTAFIHVRCPLREVGSITLLAVKNMIDLNKSIAVNRPELRDQVYDAICDAVQTGTWEVLDGALEWRDMIDVTLRNKSNGRIGRFEIDVYHGRSGSWAVK